MINGKKLVNKKFVVLAIWIVVILLSVPAVMSYGHYLNYSNGTSTPTGSESYEASQILSNTSQRDQSLEIVIQGNVYTNLSLDRKVLKLQDAINESGIKGIKAVSSPLNEYETYIENLAGSTGYLVDSLYSKINNTSQIIYNFPYQFYVHWSNYSYNKSDINISARESGFNNSSYERIFIYNLGNLKGSGISLIKQDINLTLNEIGHVFPLQNFVVSHVSILNFSNKISLSSATSAYVSDDIGFNLSWQIVYSIISSSDPGYFYVYNFGLNGAPSFITSQGVSPNSAIMLLDVDFNAPSGFQYRNGSSPSQIAYPKIENLTSTYLNNSAIVTGTGAISVQTAQVTAKSGFAFGLIFIILLIAIFITLVSYWSSLVALFLVGLSLLMGYVSIFITGLIIGNVSFIVNYTLTAVILGISTDYLVFIISRYRREIREGKDPKEAIFKATDTAGKAVIISGITVAFTLLTFSFVPTFLDWGIVLFQAVIYTVLIQVTLLPISVYFLRNRLIMKRGLKPLTYDSHKSSVFYKTTDLSVKKASAVALVFIILGTMGVYFFYTVPTTYNFNTGLPQDLSSVKGLNLIYQNFGEDKIFPVFVIYKAGFVTSHLNNTENQSLIKVANALRSEQFVTSVSGPFISGKNISNRINPINFQIDHGKYFLFIVTLNSNPYSDTAIQDVMHLRSNSSYIVGGLTSEIIDERAQNNSIYYSLEIFILISIFVILLIAFRQLRYPIIAISGTFFSISWSTFILYYISMFILHIQLIYLIPVILFIILFSIGNDYTVFIASNIKEETKKDGFEEGIRKGMVNGAKTITALGLILAFSLGALSLIPVAFLEELGIAFIISLLIDTFLIRTFYFPALLTIFHKIAD
ncbi:MMPL family transporter [Cuniculiplasma sp. SKW4]|uniref:MMPL family transporter n=1 Tax=Cuniculiplasma sp. SKW4 TaxID=3400171 RepID=UPI003FD2ED0C